MKIPAGAGKRWFMDLKTFVSEVITQVGEGILDAQERSNNQYSVSPLVGFSDGNIQLTGSEKQSYVQSIDFDIAIVVQDKDGTQAGGKLSIPFVNLSLGASNSEEKLTGNTSRVRFSIPVVWPYQNIVSHKK